PLRGDRARAVAGSGGFRAAALGSSAGRYRQPHGARALGPRPYGGRRRVGDARGTGADDAARAAAETTLIAQETLKTYGISSTQTAPHPPVGRLAPSGARDATDARSARLPAVRRSRARRAPRRREHARDLPAVGGRGGGGCEGGGRGGGAGRSSLRRSRARARA